MKNIWFLLIIFIIGCNGPQKREVQTTTESELTAGQFEIIADTITYDVIIRNPNPDDTWTESCLSRLRREDFISYFFDEIKNGRLTAYDYETNQPMTYEQIEKLKSENDNKMVIGKLQFTEVWAFDKVQMRMFKKIHSAVFGYESYLDGGNEIRGYKAAFRIYFK